MKSVYVVTAANATKIGLSGNLNQRMQSLQWERQEPLTLSWSKQSDIARYLERKAHKVLEDRCIKGEWFDCTVDEAIEAIAHATRVYAQHTVMYPTELIAMREAAKLDWSEMAKISGIRLSDLWMSYTGRRPITRRIKFVVQVFADGWRPAA